MNVTHIHPHLAPAKDSAPINMTPSQPFSRADALAFILHSADKDNGGFPVKDEQLNALKHQLSHAVNEQLSGLSGLGGIIQHTNIDGIQQGHLESFGKTIERLARQADETLNQLAAVNRDIERRANDRRGV